MKMLYEGKAKQIFETDSEDLIVKFKNTATAFDGKKKDEFEGKSELNLAFSEYFFDILTNHGIESHFVKKVDKSSMLVKHVKIIPLEVVVRNVAAGSICKRENYTKGYVFPEPLAEFFFKDDDLGDPLMSESEILEKKLATKEQIELLKFYALKVNSVLKAHLDEKSIVLVDFKLEFGFLTNTDKIILADEISPDTCRFWLKESNESLDKDVFREGTNDIITTYSKFANILNIKV